MCYNAGVEKENKMFTCRCGCPAHNHNSKYGCMTCACMKFTTHRHADFEINPARGRLADVLVDVKSPLDKTGEMLYNVVEVKNVNIRIN